MAETPAEKINDKAFTIGAEETTYSPIIYIDSDEITLNEKDLIEQLDDQVPGSANALLERLQSSGEVKTLKDLAILTKTRGPFAVKNFLVDEQENFEDEIYYGDEVYCVINKPNENIDNSNELIREFVSKKYSEEIIQAIIDNTPINDAGFNKAIGRHEGEHCNQGPKYTTHGILDGEVKADQTVIDGFKNDGNDDAALAYKDLRHLSDTERDPKHATGLLLDTGDKASITHITVAQSHRLSVDHRIDLDIGLDRHESCVIKAKDLLNHDPERYFEEMNDRLNDIKEDHLDKYNENPTYEYAYNLLVAQGIINSAKGFEGAYRRRALGQDFPEHEPVQLITQEHEEFLASKVESMIKPAMTVLEIEATVENYKYELEDIKNNILMTKWDLKEAQAELAKAEVNAGLTPEQIEEAYKVGITTQEIAKYLADNAELTKSIQEKIEKLEGNIVKQKESKTEIEIQIKESENELSDAKDALEKIQNTRIESPAHAKEADKEYQAGKDGTAYTTLVDGITKGEPNVDFEKGVSVDGTSMPETFAQSANPDLENVKLVNATELPPENQIIPPIPAANNSQYSAQSYG